MKGGYCGKYKTYFLDSSYEYICCKIFEKNNIIFKMHVISYDLGYKKYTPDFFIYDENENIVKIIEVRGHRLNLEERIKDISELSRLFGIETELITELDLRVMCKKSELNYNQLKTEWRTNPENKKNYNKDNFNAMYGKHHSEKTKKILSEKGKERMKDKEYLENITHKMLQWSIQNNWKQCKVLKSKRVVMVCIYCGNEKEVTENFAKKHKYCSNECANKDSVGLLQATEAIKRKHLERNNEIKYIVDIFVTSNKSQIKDIKLNKINTDESIVKLLEIIKIQTKIVDMRTIGLAVCGKPSGKEFVKYLKESIK